MNLHGKVVVVTGAAGGIGKNLVNQFAREGATVCGWDLSEAGLETLKTHGQKEGVEILTHKVDVTDENQLKAARDAVIAKHGGIDVWVNNAGISGAGDFENNSVADFSKVLAINLVAVMTGTHLALQVMETRGTGLVVNIASVAGLVPCPFLTAYSASKHGVVGFTRALRQELALKSSTIRLLLVCPGFVETEMLAKGTKYGFPEWLGWVPGSPADVAAAVVQGVRKEREEIFPTMNGKVLARLNRHFPGVFSSGQRLLLSKSLKDYFFNRLSG